jgi:hypothetical protein
MSFADMPSIGTATGSRVDSAAKHIMACKVDTRALQNWMDNASNVYDKENQLHTNKMKWCMHKDEIVLNTTRKKDQSDACAKAYPMVVTTLGDIHTHTMEYMKVLYAQQSAYDFYTVWKNTTWNGFCDCAPKLVQPLAKPKKILPNDENRVMQDTVDMQIKSLPEFRCQGVALGQAWASYLSGDTVASVLVGGMMTVLNGHFAMHTGDEVQWYFDFEKDSFQSCAGLDNGSRNSGDVNPRKSKDIYMDQRLYGGNSGIGKSSGLKQTDKVVRIKSYRMCRSPSNGTTASVMPQSDHYGDKSRVFAKCISGGRPFDAVDIMLMTQSS